MVSSSDFIIKSVIYLVKVWVFFLKFIEVSCFISDEEETTSLEAGQSTTTDFKSNKSAANDEKDSKQEDKSVDEKCKNNFITDFYKIYIQTFTFNVIF